MGFVLVLDQKPKKLGGYGYDAPDSQLSIQDNSNEAAAVGNGNTGVQDADQFNNRAERRCRWLSSERLRLLKPISNIIN
ncbi:MAG: hypothetical protein QNJ53_25140 [Pleurocapsa sp. MO_192.B19]|nr:hypothetical protein [Pleurocapsa sp. MO_192.B19]